MRVLLLLGTGKYRAELRDLSGFQRMLCGSGVPGAVTGCKFPTAWTGPFLVKGGRSVPERGTMSGGPHLPAQVGP